MEHARVLEASSRMKHAANTIMRGAATLDDRFPLPYYCECDAPTCRRAIWLTAAAYDRLDRGALLLAEEHEPRLAKAG